MDMKLLVASLIILTISPLRAAGNSGFSSTGVPCYLHPAADGCHYKLRPGSDFCTTASEKRRLTADILLVNRTLTSLEQQLIRLGISKMAIITMLDDLYNHVECRIIIAMYIPVLNPKCLLSI